METIIDRLCQYTERNPGAPILFDDAHVKGVTYAQLDDMSGRVYAWLKANRIGREDFVLIDLPRGVLPRRPNGRKQPMRRRQPTWRKSLRLRNPLCSRKPLLRPPSPPYARGAVKSI